MNDTMTTIVGNLTADPVLAAVGEGGRSVARLRVACTESVFQPQSRTWVDGRTSYFNVSAWGPLGENAACSFRKGQRVIVHGRLYIDQYQNKDGEVRMSVQIDARAIGHDLTWGTSHFTRFIRSQAGDGGSTGHADTVEQSSRDGANEGQAAEGSGPATVDAPGSRTAGGREDLPDVGDYVEIDGIFVDEQGVVLPQSA
ncbi:MAG: single-stranded DNA-binding protein [Actinomycetales bacterium]